ncbi:MAG: hypothetical protein HON53_00825, partial [Planctomycetaceae bacterium]|nr:hypothetical protein [Planctomycetaceae bacterium]
MAKAKIDENAFDAARTLLDQYRPKGNEPDLRNWEWGRLMYLCSQELREFNAAGNVLGIDVSGDGQRLVMALEGGMIEVWDLSKSSNKPALTFSVGGNGIDVNAVVFSPDGKQIAVGTSAAKDNVTLWDISAVEAPAKPLTTFGDSSANDRFAVEHTAAVLSIQFSPDGKQLLTGSEDYTARVWDVKEGKQLVPLRGHNWFVWDAAFSPDGTQIVTAGQDGIAIVWTYNAKDVKEVRWSVPANIQQGAPFTGHTGPVFAAAFSPDGKDVVTGGYDRNVLIWKPEEVEAYRWEKLQSLGTTTGQLTAEQRVAPAAKARRLDGHIASVRAVRFFRKDSSVGSVSSPKAASSTAAATNNLLVLSSGDDGTVKVWNAATGTAIKTFRGHGSWVRTSAFAPDGQSVLSGSGDGTARQWSIADYAEIRELAGREFSGHGNAVLSASFSHNNRNIVTASQDRTAKTWSGDGRELRTFREGHEYLASSALFFPNGERMLTAAVDNSVRIWNVARGTELKRLEHTGRSAAVALSPDGKWILTGSDRVSLAEGALWSAKLWRVDSEDDKPILELKHIDAKDKTHTAEVTAVAFSPDGKLLFTGDGKGYGHLWRLEIAADGKASASYVLRLKGHTRGQRIVSARFHPNGKRVLTASTDNSVAQWDVSTGKEQKSLLLKHDDSLTAMDVATDGTRTLVLTSCADLTVRLWDAETAKEIGQLNTVGGMAALARNVTDRLKQLNRDPEFLWTDTELTKDDVSRILNPNSLRKPADFDDTLKKLASLLDVREAADLLKPYIPAVAISADGKRALTTNAEDLTVRLWDLGTLKEISIADGRSFLDSDRVASVEAAVFSPQNGDMAKKEQFILTVGGSNAQLWDEATGREQIQYSPHGSVSAAGYSPDGKFIVTAGLDSTARIWNAATGKTVAILAGHTSDVNSAVFSPDGKLVLTASSDRTARLWDATSGKELRSLEGHEGKVLQAVFSNDGRRVATASDDGTARIWEVATGTELASMDCQSGAVLCVAFSGDGKRVITGTQSQDARS